MNERYELLNLYDDEDTRDATAVCADCGERYDALEHDECPVCQPSADPTVPHYDPEAGCYVAETVAGFEVFGATHAECVARKAEANRIAWKHAMLNGDERERAILDAARARIESSDASEFMVWEDGSDEYVVVKRTQDGIVPVKRGRMRIDPQTREEYEAQRLDAVADDVADWRRAQKYGVSV